MSDLEGERQTSKWIRGRVVAIRNRTCFGVVAVSTRGGSLATDGSRKMSKETDPAATAPGKLEQETQCRQPPRRGTGRGL